MQIKFSLILFLEFVFIFQYFSSLANYCGGRAIRSFKKKLKYEPDGGGQPLEIKRMRRHEFAGSNGKVYIGYAKKSAAATNQYEGCVAIKIFGENCHANFENTKNFMQTLQNNVSVGERTHLIRMVDSGNLKKTNIGLIIMQMGTTSLEGRIYEERKNYANDLSLFEEIKKLVDPIKELHKIAVHGDVKPANFVYVNEEGTETLKLIDYDGAAIIPPAGLFEWSNKLANKVVQRDNFVATRAYAAPEYYADRVVITTKLDIWALGVIIYELILLQPVYNASVSKIKIIQNLLRIGDIYMGIKRNNSGLKESDGNSYENPLWVRTHYETLMAILHVWQTFPKTALLVTNLLHPAREVRMSAIGVRNFLDGRCLTEELRTVQQATQLNFVHRLSIGELSQMVTQRMDTVCCACCVCTDGPIYEALLDRIERVVRIVQRTMDEMKGGGMLQRMLTGRTCDTEQNR